MCPTSVLSCSVYSQTWVGLLRSVQKTGRVEIRGGGQGGRCRLSEGHVAEWSVPIHGPNRPRRRECPGTPLCLHHGLPPAIEFVLCRVLLPQRHAGLLSPCSWRVLVHLPLKITQVNIILILDVFLDYFHASE